MWPLAALVAASASGDPSGGIRIAMRSSRIVAGQAAASPSFYENRLGGAVFSLALASSDWPTAEVSSRRCSRRHGARPRATTPPAGSVAGWLLAITRSRAIINSGAPRPARAWHSNNAKNNGHLCCLVSARRVAA